MTKLLGLGLLALTSSLTACDDSNGDFDGAAANIEGIYQVSAYNRNDAACAPGGASQLGTDRFAVAFKQTIFGSSVLTVTSCASVADCREKLADMRASEPVLLQFQFAVNELDGEAFAGTGASTGFTDGGVCTGGELMKTRLELVGGAQLQIQQSITIADDYTADDGFCTTSLAQKFAEGNACSQMETLTADLVEVL